MRFARSSLFFLSALLLGSLFASQGFAEEKPRAGQLSSEFEGIRSRLAALDQQQKEILAKEDKILEELDRIRIWVHRK